MDFEQFRKETEDRIKELLKENQEKSDNKQNAEIINTLRNTYCKDILDILEDYHEKVVLD